MTVENASYPEGLDASLPFGSDFRNEGDNHIRLIKQVIKNALGTTQGIASAAEAGAITGVSDVKLATLLRVWEQVTARIATQLIAEGGVDDSRLMTSLKTNQYVSARLADQTTAETGTDNTKLLTALRTYQQITARLANQATAEARTDNTKLLTPLSGAQMANALINALKADQATAEAGASATTLMTPLASRQHGDARYLQLAQTTAFTRSMLDDSTAAGVRATLGLSAAATASISSSVSSTSTSVLANSAAVKTAYDKITFPVAGTTYQIAQISFATHSLATSFTPSYSIGVLLPGTITVWYQHAGGTGVNAGTPCTVHLYKNGVLQNSQSTTSTSLVTRSINVTVLEGDRLTFVFAGAGTVGQVRVYSGTRSGAVFLGP